jgi:hypothetical protein
MIVQANPGQMSFTDGRVYQWVDRNHRLGLLDKFHPFGIRTVWAASAWQAGTSFTSQPCEDGSWEM